MSDLLPPHIPQVRDYLTQRREEIRLMHQGGAAGSQVVAALTVLLDGIVDRLSSAALMELGPADAAVFESHMAVVAVGGFGRAELAPFSDLDLLILYEPVATATAKRLCDRLVRDFWDVKLVLGSSMRTLSECTELAGRDISVHTALLEARHIVGNPLLTGELRTQIGRLTWGRSCDSFLASVLAERAQEQARCGSNVHLLQPDIKRSKGGLRELHLLRWVAQVRHGTSALDRLEPDVLQEPDATTVIQAREFLLRVRNHLHFQAGRAQDIVTWEEQVRLAAAFGYVDRPGMLAVEQFMQQYYRHCAALDDVCDRFVRRNRRQSVWRQLVRPLATKRLDGHIRICAGELTVTPESLPSILGSLNRVVQLFATASRHGVVVAHDLREKIRAALPGMNGQDLSDTRAVFLSMLARPGKLAETLHHLHALGILERLIPDFVHARGLIQFNLYHKYTVDEHTLLCVANAERFALDRGPLGKVYREIHHKEILHLALLLHDLGKGFEVDHSELGRKIALETAERFGLDAHQRDLLVFLVYQHLLMAHLAFRRDTSDEYLLTRFARQAGTPEALRMLFVLTAADIAAVGPETWTSWKAEVLADLYARTMEKLTGQATVLNQEERERDVRDQVAASLAKEVSPDWLDAQLAAMAPGYVLTTPQERIVEHLTMIHGLADGEVLTTAAFEPQTQITAYTIYTFDNITPGLFSKIAGVLAAKGLQILSAQITTFSSGIVVDRFEVLDYDFVGEPPRHRTENVAATIRQVLRGELSIENLFAQSSRVGPRYQPRPGAMEEPTQVKIDNDSSEACTIIEVFTNDRQGLLYVITRTIFELGLSVSVAKVATSLDQVLDVFYVSDEAGEKVTDQGRVDQICDRLVDEIQRFSRPDRTAKAV